MLDLSIYVQKIISVYEPQISHYACCYKALILDEVETWLSGLILLLHPSFESFGCLNLSSTYVPA